MSSLSTTNAFVVEKEGEITNNYREIPLRAVGDSDVLVEFTCSGLCHTDHSMATNNWGISVYPMVPGHEGVGRVVSKGSAVTGLEIGDKVGVGWIAGSCSKCTGCLKGEENICDAGYVGTYLGENSLGGTWAQKQVVNSRFVFKTPETLPDAVVAPLLCAGITVYSPLRKYVKAGMKVGIVSVGGLGHLGIMFAKALGASVTVFSTSEKKRAEAIGFGANRFIVTKDPEQMKLAHGKLDVILNTCPYDIPVGDYLPCLATDGVFCYLGIPDVGANTVKLPLYDLVFNQKSVVGSIVGGSKYMSEMLELASEHNIAPSVEVVRMEKLEKTVQRLMTGDMTKYRFVMCHPGHYDEVKADFRKFKEANRRCRHGRLGPKATDL